jgi:hypothetical protein
MNPTQDNQNTPNNQTPEAQLPEKLNFFQGAPEFAVKPITQQPTAENKTADLQLENETPMDLAVQEEIKTEAPRPISNPVEVPEFTPTAPTIQNELTMNSLPASNTQDPVTIPTPSFQYDAVADYSISSGTKNPSPDTQKIVLVIAGILGSLIVFGGGYYFLKSRTQNKSIEPVTIQSTNNETPAQPLITTPQTMTLASYQKQIIDLETKTITTIKNAQINVNAPTQNVDQIRFASDNLFANYQELMQMNVTEELKPLHSQLVTNYKLLSDSYDIILKSLKETNKITPEAKAAYSLNYNKAVVGIDDSIAKIKALK